MSLRPEHQLLLQLSSENTSREEILEFITSINVSWPFFLEEAIRHSVGPLLHEEIQRLTLEQILPPHVVQGLKTSKEQTSLQNFFLFTEAKSVIQRLEGRRIPCILLKGSSLSQNIYKNIALRPCSDVDILVPKDALEEVKNTFFKLGFHFPPDLMDERFYYRNHFHIPFHKTLTHSPILIEVHWHLMDPYLLGAIDISEIWNSKKPIRFEGIETYGLSQEDELIYLSLHILKHGYMNIFIASDIQHIPHFFNPIAENKLLWFVDLKKILEAQKDINWDFLIDRSSHWGVLESIRPIFLLLKWLFPHTNIPHDFLKPQTPPKLSRASKILYKTLLSKSHSAFIRKHLLTMKGDLQFRLIRVFDLFDYLFPNHEILRNLYHFRNVFLSLYFYPFHFFKGVITATLGLFQWLIFRLKKR